MYLILFTIEIIKKLLLIGYKKCEAIVAILHSGLGLPKRWIKQQPHTMKRIVAPIIDDYMQPM